MWAGGNSAAPKFQTCAAQSRGGLAVRIALYPAVAGVERAVAVRRGNNGRNAEESVDAGGLRRGDQLAERLRTARRKKIATTSSIAATAMSTVFLFLSMGFSFPKSSLLFAVQQGRGESLSNSLPDQELFDKPFLGRDVECAVIVVGHHAGRAPAGF